MTGSVWKGRLLYGGLVAALVAADQIVKDIVEQSIPLGSSVKVLPFLDLFHTRNFGVAFSMLSGSAWLGWLSVGVIALMGWLWYQSDPRDRLVQWGFALIIGGAIGNLIDRFMLGHVTDYVFLNYGTWSFAVFNLADAFITIGVCLILLGELIAWRKGRTGHDSN